MQDNANVWCCRRCKHGPTHHTETCGEYQLLPDRYRVFSRSMIEQKPPHPAIRQTVSWDKACGFRQDKRKPYATIHIPFLGFGRKFCTPPAGNRAITNRRCQQSQYNVPLPSLNQHCVHGPAPYCY